MISTGTLTLPKFNPRMLGFHAQAKRVFDVPPIHHVPLHASMFADLNSVF